MLFQSGSKDKPQEGFKTKKCKLELLASFSLFGNIVSMQGVKLAGNPRDSLLLSFKEAKVGAVKPPLDNHLPLTAIFVVMSHQYTLLSAFKDPSTLECQRQCCDFASNIAPIKIA